MPKNTVKNQKNRLRTRTLSLRGGPDGSGPATLDAEARTVEVTAATEAPVRMYDWDRDEFIDEILLMSGCRMPESGQLPLLDTHSRGSVQAVVGSLRDLRIEGDQLVGRAHLSAQPEGEAVLAKLREGHLTDFSVGYRVREATRVGPGERTVVDGREYAGPVILARDWEPKELSVCPIGADPNAKARAAAQTIDGGEEEEMDKRMRSWLESLGLARDASEEEAWRYFDEVKSRGGGPDGPGRDGEAEGDAGRGGEVDPAEAARRAVAEERARTADIQAMGRECDCPELAEELVRSGAGIEEAGRAIYKKLRERMQGGPRPAFEVQMGPTEPEKVRAAVTDGLLLRSGLSVEAPADGADQFRGRRLDDIAREMLIRAGHRPSGSIMDVIGRAFTSSDFPNILANVANLQIMRGWETANETWRVWVDDTGQVSDFKPSSLVNLSEFDDLEELPESGEYTHGQMADAKEQVQIVTFGRMFALTRQLIINDDLGSLSDVPRAMGEAAARKVGDLPYAVLTGNSAMADGVALFHADHSNLAGSGGVVSVTTLGAGELAMASQTDLLGKRRLNIQPQFLIAPPAIKRHVETFCKSDKYRDSSDAEWANIYAGSEFTRVYEPRLGDDSTTAWYLAGPKGRTVRVFWLHGVKTPYMEQQQGWTVDGVSYKIRIDAAAKATDYRGLYRNPGA